MVPKVNSVAAAKLARAPESGKHPETIDRGEIIGRFLLEERATYWKPNKNFRLHIYLSNKHNPHSRLLINSGNAESQRTTAQALEQGTKNGFVHERNPISQP